MCFVIILVCVCSTSEIVKRNWFVILYLFEFIFLVMFICFVCLLDLIKLGIDPEAYCFLCKKEFCSKYFLMSHKLNIHGFKAEGSETVSTQRGSTAPRGTITPPTSVSPVSATSPVQAQAPPAIGLSAETFQWRWKDSGSERKVRYQLYEISYNCQNLLNKI